MFFLEKSKKKKNKLPAETLHTGYDLTIRLIKRITQTLINK